jgi:16S rRNA (adenine1518-N6/adenine1519-N6)-dimethyltransferase
MPKIKTSPSSDVKKSLRQSGLKARKGLGQNFLIDDTVLNNIISAADLTAKDFVIEVGPGLGTLTSELVKNAGTVVAVELDEKLSSQLKLKFSGLANLCVINADILEVNIADLLKDQRTYKVVANIPYYITSPIFHYFLEAPLKPSLMVMMMQREVGEAIIAEPGKLSMLAISVQVFSKPRVISIVSPQSFYPQPKVESVIVRFDVRDEPAVKVMDLDNFLSFVKCGFKSPRKQLRNSLATGLGKKTDEISLLLVRANIDSQRRAETLTLNEWQNLYEVTIPSGTNTTSC